MCGINGFSWKDEGTIKKMVKKTSHRGPDGEDIFVSEDISLGHNRLAIIDLSDAGRQPMESSDGNLIIVFNGEIYNFQELRKELGWYPFQSSSDTEVILAAYSAWGTKAFCKLNGIFSLAVFDKSKRELVLARDPVGVKPLYYSFIRDRLIFSSEIKAILEHDFFAREIGRDALELYLRVLYVPEPLTMFKGIKKLPPGHFLRFRDGRIEISKYLSFASEILGGVSEYSPEELKKRVNESVKNQLVSDRPLGLYLSGGIDSSAVLESMSAVRSRVETFSVGFELEKSEEREKFNADFNLARETAKFFGASHHETLLKKTDIISLFEDAVYMLDEPVSNATIIPMIALSREAKKRVSVVLGGDGGDELFGGYDRYRYSLMSSKFRVMPKALASLGKIILPSFNKFDTAPGIERFAQFMFQKDSALAPLVSPGILRDFASGFFLKKYFQDIQNPFETQFMETDRKTWLVDESLLRSDKLSMANGLEARVPLLDLSLLAYSSNIPLREKISFFQTKICFKKAFRDSLPKELFLQPKRGWFSPGAKWLRDKTFSKYARIVLAADYHFGTKDAFNWAEVRKRLDAHIDGAYHFNPLWALLTFQVWAKKYDAIL